MKASPLLCLPDHLHPDWRALLVPQTRLPYWHALREFLAAEWQQHKIYPPPADIFNAFLYTPLSQLRVVLLGQDPYHQPGQAHGLAFSVPLGIPPPPSLRNILRELQNDLGYATPDHGTLIPWARQGVLLLNTCLTVRQGQPQSHTGRGWELFTQAVLHQLNHLPRRLVFLAWGRPAQITVRGINTARHVVITAAHPSPLSAARGFFGSRPFSRTNQALQQLGMPIIDWQLPPRASLLAHPRSS
jgi:uracil-DNA glycosylase